MCVWGGGGGGQARGEAGATRSKDISQRPLASSRVPCTLSTEYKIIHAGTRPLKQMFTFCPLHTMYVMYAPNTCQKKLPTSTKQLVLNNSSRLHEGESEGK